MTDYILYNKYEGEKQAETMDPKLPIFMQERELVVIIICIFKHHYNCQ